MDGIEDFWNCIDLFWIFICKKSLVFLKRFKFDLLFEVDNCNKKNYGRRGGGGGLVSKRRVDLMMCYCVIV